MNQKVEIDVTNLEVVENFIELVAKYQDELPIELQNSLKEIAEFGLHNIDREYISSINSSGAYTSEDTENLKAMNANRILKKVLLMDKSGDMPRIKKIYPKHFWIKDIDTHEIIEEW